MHSPILGPIVALAAWTLVMWAWMYATRLPAMARTGIDGTKLVGSTSRSLRDDLVAAGELRASWVADNYNHLHEQPVVFYAIALVLALAGSGAGLNAGLAWGYVGLRIVHSLVQVTGNIVKYRFAAFALGTIILLMLTVHAGLAVAGMHHL